jgi:hypothetical protein
MLDNIKQTITELARPFSIYACSLAVAIGLFVPSVTEAKMWVAAAVAGGVAAARTADKRAAYQAGIAKVEG